MFTLKCMVYSFVQQHKWHIPLRQIYWVLFYSLLESGIVGIEINRESIHSSNLCTHQWPVLWICSEKFPAIWIKIIWFYDPWLQNPAVPISNLKFENPLIQPNLNLAQFHSSFSAVLENIRFSFSPSAVLIYVYLQDITVCVCVRIRVCESFCVCVCI